MVALTLYVFRVHEPDLLGEVEPLGSGKPSLGMAVYSITSSAWASSDGGMGDR